ncbi:MAG: helix-turn-helix domain-containing protein, partial [Candidatus Eremiobacteraeota bacterium]|nr:helix-turn-helix domain-containing protein [Candidatus Eremiobacteraeota bacterium]
DTTPARWVQSLRVEAAMQHLEDPNASLKMIAQITGFRDEQQLRRAFVQHTALTPKQYRERFGEFDRHQKTNPSGAVETQSSSRSDRMASASPRTQVTKARKAG